LAVGIVIGWWLRGGAPQPIASLLPPPQAPIAAPTTGDSRPGITDSEPAFLPPSSGAAPIAPSIGANPIAELRDRNLRLPLEHVDVETMKGGFEQGRDRGQRPHEAVDLMAPRNTPIRAVEDGTIAKLFLSKAGGLTIYQYDPTQRFCYYYAHLEKYADGLQEGQAVHAGDLLGYVGSSGNASPDAPHLHFAIFKLTDDHHWWQGTALDPYAVFAQGPPPSHQSPATSH
jgi:murein DD-endopeptidase MepM/ murein hydrolase activator NlpD